MGRFNLSKLKQKEPVVSVVERPKLETDPDEIAETYEGLSVYRKTFRYNHFVNTQLFREAAITFAKNGYYTDAPEDTEEYDTYWDIEEDRCLNGYQVGDLWIPGKYYFYLNYCPIYRLASEKELEKNPHSRMVVGFPGFWEIDYAYWMTKHEAWQRALRGERGNHIAILKTRRGGFSYKEAADGNWNFIFVPNSKNYYFAASKEYLVKDAVFNKVSQMLDFINEHTAFRRTRGVVDNKYHKRASFMDMEDGVEKGYMSETMTVVMDTADKARGKEGLKIAFEEGGTFKHLLDAWVICRPQVEQGGVVKGQMTAFGTGGTEKAHDISGLSELFYECHRHNVIGFENIWDDGLQGTECGLFIPATAILEDCMDHTGYLDQQKAFNRIQEIRKIEGGNDTKSRSFLKMCAESPLNPGEALLRPSISFFDTVAVDMQIKRIKRDELHSIIAHGHMNIVDSKVDFVVDLDVVPVKYPHRTSDDNTGCVSIFELPTKIEGEIPEDLYFVCFDPYYVDQSELSVSLGACYVFKRSSSGIKGDKIVAWYVGRPRTREKMFQQVLYLTMFYNAKCAFELSGGGQGFYEYAKSKGLLDYLHYEPEVLNHSGGKTKRNYGQKVTTDMKQDGLQLYADWIIAERGIDEDGEVIRNIDLIFDVGLLTETLRYNPVGNFDRISAMVVGMWQRKEMSEITVQEKQKSNGFFDRPMFTGGTGISHQEATWLNEIRKQQNTFEI